MKKQLLIFSALILCLAPSISEGINWEHYMQNSAGDNYYVDLDSIKHTSSDTIRLLKKVEPKDSSKHTRSVSNIEMDCKEKRTKLLQKTTYNNTNITAATNENEKWRHVTADDIDELLFELICSLKKPQD